MRSRPTALLTGTFLSFLAATCFAVDAQTPLPADNAGAPSLDFANGLYARKMYGPAISEYAKFISEHPESPDVASAKFRLAESFYFTKDYAKAVPAYQDFTRRFPKEPRVPIALFRLGTSKYYLKEYDKAQKIFFRLARQAEDPVIRAGALFYFAKSHEAMGRLNRMEKLMKRVIKNYPQSDYAAYSGLWLGDLYASQKNYGNAVLQYRVAANRPAPALAASEAQFKIAEVYYAQKDYKNAETYYLKLLEAAKGAPGREQEFGQAMKGLFYCEYALKDLAKATELYRSNQDYFTSGAGRDESLYVLASLAFDQKDSALSLEALERILNAPENPAAFMDKAHFKKAAVLSALGKKDEALAEVQKVIDAPQGDKARAHAEKAALLKEAGRSQEAIEAYTAVLSAPENDYSKNALYETAAIRLNAGDTAGAEKDFLSFAEKYPQGEDAERARLQAAQIELDLENFEAAEKNAGRVIREYPQSTLLDIAYYKQGLALTGLKRFNEATGPFLRVAEHFPSSPFLAESLYGAAAGFERGGQAKEAAAHYERLIKQFPEHELSKGSRVRLGHLHIEREEYDKAAAVYEDILANHPSTEVPREALFWLIRYDLERGRYAEMQRTLDGLSARFPGNDLRHATAFFQGESAMGLKDYAKAAQYYAEAIRVGPDGEYVPHSHLGLGIVHAAQNDLKTADEHFARALNYDNEVVVCLRARFEMAGLRLRAGDLEAAAKAYMLVAVLYEDDKYCPQALLKAGECYTKLGRKDEAAKVFAELKKRFPDSDAAKKVPVTP